MLKKTPDRRLRDPETFKQDHVTVMLPEEMYLFTANREFLTLQNLLYKLFKNAFSAYFNKEDKLEI